MRTAGIAKSTILAVTFEGKKYSKCTPVSMLAGILHLAILLIKKCFRKRIKSLPQH